MFAGRAAFFKLPAGRGPPFVNAANRFFARFAIERGAAGWAVVGAAHAAGALGDGRSQPRGHIAAAFFVFVNGKIHPKAHAACAAGGAVGHGVNLGMDPGSSPG